MDPLFLISEAKQILDLSGGHEDRQAIGDMQLKAAVDIVNRITNPDIQKTAYLADEVGMGKTYVALAAMALYKWKFPNSKVLIITPRANIQSKWEKDYQNFFRNNVKDETGRLKSLNDEPIYYPQKVDNLRQLVELMRTSAPNISIMKMSSFSIPVPKGKRDEWKKQAKKLIEQSKGKMPTSYRSQEEHKNWYASEVERVLPKFDLIIVDEAHNLKRGPIQSTRNIMLNSILPNKSSKSSLLLLSATPWESNKGHMFTPMHVFGKSMHRETESESLTKDELKKWLIRRLNTVNIGDQSYTRNQYRKEWRHGGVDHASESLQIQSVEQKLIVSLIQKKVTEILKQDQFNNSFQMGLLASFESFKQTASHKATSEEAALVDDAMQTSNQIERTGVDLESISQINKSFVDRFDREMPHPKMDAVVNGLKEELKLGKKVLIFVRRVGSVKELESKISNIFDEQWQDWFHQYLSKHLSSGPIFQQYRSERNRWIKNEEDETDQTGQGQEVSEEKVLRSNFYSWFSNIAKGEIDHHLPHKWNSPETIKKELVATARWTSIIFSENYYFTYFKGYDIPQEAMPRILEIVTSVFISEYGQSASGPAFTLNDKWTENKRRIFNCAQYALIIYLNEKPRQDIPKSITKALMEDLRLNEISLGTNGCPPAQYDKIHDYFQKNLLEDLNRSTMITALNKQGFFELEVTDDEKSSVLKDAVYNRRMFVELLGSCLKMGQGIIEYWGITNAKSKDQSDIDAFVQYLTQNKASGYLREMQEIHANLTLILDNNFSDARRWDVKEVAKKISLELRQQKPVLGMSGEVVKRGVLQFRMPGYPIALISTDVLQEGEDLHLFCDKIIHYGISYTSTSMEQKTGRVDRIGSLTSRRLNQRDELKDPDKIQVLFPFLQETVEVFQMNRLFHRMNDFISTLHEFDENKEEKSIVQLDEELSNLPELPAQIEDTLKSPYQEVVYKGGKRDAYQMEVKRLKENQSVQLEWFKTLLKQIQENSNCTLTKISTSKYLMDVNGIQIQFMLHPSKQTPETLLSVSWSSEINSWNEWVSKEKNVFEQLHSRVRGHLRSSDGKLTLDHEVLFGEEETQLTELTRIIDLIQIDVATLKSENQSELKLKSGWKSYNPKKLKFSHKLLNRSIKDSDYGADFQFEHISHTREGEYWTINLGARQQKIYLDVKDDTLRLRSKACKVKSLTEWNTDITHECIRINDETEIVSFLPDKKFVWGYVYQPMDSIQVKELVYYVRSLAVACDRLEFLVEQGRDEF